jgi:hypothetical protein
MGTAPTGLSSIINHCNSPTLLDRVHRSALSCWTTTDNNEVVGEICHA